MIENSIPQHPIFFPDHIPVRLKKLHIPYAYHDLNTLSSVNYDGGMQIKISLFLMMNETIFKNLIAISRCQLLIKAKELYINNSYHYVCMYYEHT